MCLIKEESLVQFMARMISISINIREADYIYYLL
jgi:hypothetical protein